MTRSLKTLTTALLAFLLCTGFGSGERLFAPGAEPWPRWEASDPASTVVVDHGAWTAFLARHVVAGGDSGGSSGGAARVRYGAVPESDRRALADYIAALAATPVARLNRSEQLAFWINLYNALTVRTVLEHYPVASIRDIDISPGLFADGPWGKKLVAIDGEPVSLNDIEHRILRPLWRDNRVHYAVNCASVGCPDLQTRAYTGATADAMLTDAARAYVNSPRGVSIRDGRVTVSKIYDWFLEDFGGSEAGVLAHLEKHAAPGLRRRLAAIGAIDDVAYDWRLNDAAP